MKRKNRVLLKLEVISNNGKIVFSKDNIYDYEQISSKKIRIYSIKPETFIEIFIPDNMLIVFAKKHEIE